MEKPKSKKQEPQPLWEGFLFLFIKILYFIILLKKMNIVLAFAILLITIFLYHKFMYYFYGLEALSGYDKIFLTTYKLNRYPTVAVCRYKNFDIEKIKKVLIEKMISKLGKMRSYIVKKNFEYFWYEDPDQEKAFNRIKIIPRLKDYDNLLEYIHSETNNHLDIFNDYPYELIIVPFGDGNEGACLYKYDHLLSDGLGIVESLVITSDDFTEECYPKLMRKIREPNLIQTIYLYLSTPFFIIYFFSRFIFLYGKRDCPYKANLEKPNDDSKFVLSKSFRLKDFEKFRKTYTVSFNDIMLCAFSMAINNLFKKDDKYKNIKNLVLDLPVGRKSPKKDIDLVEIDNQASLVLCDIPLINNISDYKKVTKPVRKYFRPEILLSVKLVADLIGNFVPWQIITKNSFVFNQRFDFMFTNVPGPSKKVSYYGVEVSDMMSFPAAGGGLPFVLIVSYNENFKFLINSVENADWDIKELLSEYEKTLEQFII